MSFHITSNGWLFSHYKLNNYFVKCVRENKKGGERKPSPP